MSAVHVGHTMIDPGKAREGSETGRARQPSDEPSSDNVPISLMITKRQRVELERRGFSDDAIRDMRPADAHGHLGLQAGVACDRKEHQVDEKRRRRPLGVVDAAEAVFRQAPAKPPEPVTPAALPGARELVSLRIDQDVLAHFQEQGPGWQDRVNQALRKAAGLA